MKLYGYYRSSAAFRVRIALGLKGLDWEPVYVHLRRGDQFAPDYAALNPQRQVPTLVDGANVVVQSAAILEYLEETHPEPPLLPSEPAARARVRAIAMAVACDIHPIDNLRVLRYLGDELGRSEDEIRDWYNHWIALGFTGIEGMLAGNPATGAFCHGDAPTLADVFLVPQVINAARFELDLAPYPAIARVFEACMRLEAFDRAQPAKQPDAE